MKQRGVNLCAANYENFPAVQFIDRGIKRPQVPDQVNPSEIPGAGDHEIAPAGQRLADRFERFATHQDRVPHCHLFEPPLLTAKTPGDSVILSNYPIPGHRHDCFHPVYSKPQLAP